MEERPQLVSADPLSHGNYRVRFTASIVAPQYGHCNLRGPTQSTFSSDNSAPQDGHVVGGPYTTAADSLTWPESSGGPCRVGTRLAPKGARQDTNHHDDTQECHASSHDCHYQRPAMQEDVESKVQWSRDPYQQETDAEYFSQCLTTHVACSLLLVLRYRRAASDFRIPRTAEHTCLDFCSRRSAVRRCCLQPIQPCAPKHSDNC